MSFVCKTDKIPIPVYHSIADENQYVTIAELVLSSDEDVFAKNGVFEIKDERSCTKSDPDPFGCRFCRRTGTYIQSICHGPFHSKECPRYADSQ
jgi:hypothetical protein